MIDQEGSDLGSKADQGTITVAKVQIGTWYAIPAK